MKRLIQIIVLLPFMFFGCSDSSNGPQPIRNEFIKGDVSFILKTSVNFEQMINTIFAIGEIHHIKANLYQSSTKFPKDSVQFIKKAFVQYDFIDTALTLIKYDDNYNQWSFYIWIRGFNENNISQWNGLMNQFNMIPIPNVSEHGLLKVEEGKESYWINQLRETGLFEWVDYNYIANIGH